MKAMLLDRIYDLQKDQNPLRFTELPVPRPSRGEVQIKVEICGVCHTELDEIEGRTPPSFFPIVPGHQVVGYISEIGEDGTRFRLGERVGVSWLFRSCGHCYYCSKGKENLCDQYMATGRDAHGGYAQYMVAPERNVFRIPGSYKSEEAAPLLCAGAVGYRSLQLTELSDGESIGFSGFGASAHLVLQITRFLFPASKTYVFSRNQVEREFALQIGADWAGDFTEDPPEKIDKIIDTTPAWKPVVKSLGHLRKGGRLVINAIRKVESDKNYLNQLSYTDHLWLEKEIKTVANVTADDVKAFLEVADRADFRVSYEVYELEDANHALLDLKSGSLRGAKILRIPQ